jgi:hypothetical protein
MINEVDSSIGTKIVGFARTTNSLTNKLLEDCDKFDIQADIIHDNRAGVKVGQCYCIPQNHVMKYVVREDLIEENVEKVRNEKLEDIVSAALNDESDAVWAFISGHFLKSNNINEAVRNLRRKFGRRLKIAIDLKGFNSQSEEDKITRLDAIKADIIFIKNRDDAEILKKAHVASCVVFVDKHEVSFYQVDHCVTTLPCHISTFNVANIPASIVGKRDAFIGAFFAMFLMMQGLDVCAHAGHWAAKKLIKQAITQADVNINLLDYKVECDFSSTCLIRIINFRVKEANGIYCVDTEHTDFDPSRIRCFFKTGSLPPSYFLVWIPSSSTNEQVETGLWCLSRTRSVAAPVNRVAFSDDMAFRCPIGLIIDGAHIRSFHE